MCFIAVLGPEFESRIRQNEINNPKFNFLNPGDPYHAYFQQKVADIKEQDDKGEIDGCSVLTRLDYSRYSTYSRCWWYMYVIVRFVATYLTTSIVF